MKRIYFVLIICILSVAIKAQPTIWGLTSLGGTSNGFSCGVVFGMPTGGTAITQSFSLARADGETPSGMVELSNGKFIGVTFNGGWNQKGVLFEYDPVTNIYTKKFDFGGLNGEKPSYPPMLASNGKLYGLTEQGGASGNGVLYEYDPVTNIYTKKIDFMGTSNGSLPDGGMIQLSNGKIYGFTTSGGTLAGTVFEYDIPTNVLTKKADFTNTTGKAPAGAPVQAANGKLYGMCSAGGTNSVGTIFEFNITTSTITKFYDLNSVSGHQPIYGLTQAANGKLYGTTPLGASSGKGTILEVNPTTNGVGIVYMFPATGVSGSFSRGEFYLHSNGKLYGHNSNDAAGTKGCIYEFDPSTYVFTKLLDIDPLVPAGHNPINKFVKSSANGKWYLLTSIGGGSTGTINQYDFSTNTLVRKYNFHDFTNGRTPYGSLFKASNGKFYGMTRDGGAYTAAGQGILFEYDPSTAQFKKHYDFGDAADLTPAQPYGELMQASNGKLYGMTYSGGNIPGGGGMIFEFDITSNVFTPKAAFDGTLTGRIPYGSLIQHSNGKLYGMNSVGGANNQGVLFEYDIPTNAITKKYDFSVTSGYSARGSLVSPGNGKLYGMTQSGGVSGSAGVIFEYDPALNTYTIKYNFTPTTQGASPYGNLVLGANGKFYGLTAGGGTNGFGVLFEYDYINDVYTKKYDFNTIPGSRPFGSLYLASNGNLYGMTRDGGTSNKGVVFEYNSTSNTYTKKFDFSDPVGATPQYGHFIETCAIPFLPGAISGSSVICLSQASAINYSIQALTNATSYTWTVPVGAVITAGGSTNSMTVNLSSLSAGVYTLGISGINSCGTGLSAIKTITISGTPTISISPSNPSVCNGSSVTLTASGASSFTWSTASNNSTISVAPSSNTTYSVVGSNGGSCTNSAVVTVTVNSLPVISISGPTNICVGQSASLVASGANTYTWSTSATGNSISTSPTVNTTYTVTGTSVAGCSNTSVKSITVNSVPSVSISGNSTTCSGQTLSLLASGASTYTWDTGPTTPNIIVTPTTNTTYTVIGTSANSCSNVAIKSIAVNPLPTLSVSGPSVICSGNSLTLSAVGANTYTWSTSATTSSIVVSPTASINYSVNGTDGNGCVGISVKSISVNPLPTINISGSSSMCVGSNLVLTASGANTYSWNTSATSVSISISPTITTNYSVTGVDANGCSNFALKTVTVYGNPTVSISGSSVACSGQTLSLLANGASTYSWDTGPTTANIIVSPTVNTTYTVTGYSANSCTNIAIKSVSVNSLPNVSISGSSVTCSGNSLTLNASGANTYTWSTNAIVPSIVVSPTASITYTVNGTDANGCVGISTKSILVNPLPNISISGNNTLCLSGNITLTVTGANTYTWNTSATTTTINISPTVTTSYSVTGTDANGCNNSSVKTVSVITTPATPASIVGPATVCIGSTQETFSVNPVANASSYVWTLPSGWTGSSLTNMISAIPNNNGGQVAVFATNGCGSSGTQTLNISMSASPTVAALANPSVICSGNSVTITASGANTYSWSTSATTSAIAVSPAATTMYTVVGFNAAGCTNTQAITVGVFPSPTLNISSTNSILCIGQSATLSANGANNYNWTPGGSGSSIVISPSVNTTYTVNGTASNGCISTSVITQNVANCTGIDNLNVFDNANFEIFPNPFTTKITVVCSSINEIQVRIYNALGDLVNTYTVKGKAEISLAEYSNGIYFVKVGGVTKKLIKE